MRRDNTKAGKSKKLRAKAEKDLKKRAIKTQELSARDPKKTLHELEVHQIQLEMQNEELRRAQKELEDSRNKYSDLYDFAPVGYFTFDKNGVILEANLAGCRMLGVERANLIKKPFRFFIDKESQDKFYHHRQQVFKTATRQICEITIVRKNKEKIEALLESIPAKDTKGNLTLCRTALTDITEHKQARETLRQSNTLKQLTETQQEELQSTNEELIVQQEELRTTNDQLTESEAELRKLNRILKALSSSNQAMMRARDEQDYLNEVCKIIDKDCGYAMVWIGYAQDDEKKTVRSVASAGFEEGYLETLKISWDDTERGRGPTGTAIRTGKISMCKNMLTDPAFKPWRKDALKRGYASSIVLPLLAEGRVFGALSIYSKEPDPFTKDEVKLLTELADDLSYGISLIRSRATRQKAEEALRDSEERLRLAHQAAKIGAFEWNIQTGVNVWTPELEAMYGLARGEFGKSQPAWEQMVHPKDRAAAVGLVNQTLESGEPVEGEWRVVWRDGSVHWIAGRFQGFKDTAGKPLRLAGVNIDITERKKAEESLRQSEERLRLSQDAGQIGIWDWNIVTGELKWTQKLENIYGLEPGTVRTYQDFIKYVHPDDTKRVEKESKTAIEQHKSFELEFRIIKPGKNIGWVYCRGGAIYDEAGKPIRAFGVNIDITERKNIQEALQKSQEEYHHLVESSNSIIMKVDKDLNITYMNEFGLNFFGYSVNEIIGKNVIGTTIPPKDHDGKDMVSMAKDIIQHPGKYSTNVHQNMRKDGSLVWVSWSNKDIYDEKGHLVEILAIGNDLSKLVEAQEKLRKSEEKFSTLYSSMTEGVALHDIILNDSGKPIDYIITDVNPAFESITGLSRDKVIGKKASDVYRTGLAPYLDIFGQVALAGKPVLFDTYFEQMKKYFSISAFSPAKGTFATVFQDISERKQNEANQILTGATLRILNSSRDLYSSIHEVIHLIKKTTGFEAVGLRLRKGDDFPYFEQDGFSQDFLKEENFLCEKGGEGAIIRDAKGKVVLECTCGLVLDGKTDPAMPCFTKNGSFWTNKSTDLLALTPLEDPRTNPRNRCIHVGYQSVGLFPIRSGNEIIGLLQLNGREEDKFTPELIHFYERLGDNIGLALKRKQTEEEMAKLNEEFKRSNEDLEQFAYTASHDLREPLRGINGFVELLQRSYSGKLDEKGLGYIKYIIDSTQRMDELLLGLLNFSRIQMQGKPFTPVSARLALDGAMANLKRSIDDTKAVITNDELPTLNADGSQLILLFQNLIANAIKFKGENKPEIHIGCKKKDNFWQFSVKDNGIGIDPQFKERIFVIFQRLHSRDKYPGYGIGLSVCKRIVERHGGKIWLDSKPGNGSTFYFTIPA